ncbi:CcoQ/FixQ family Cbb3-type cytochrome c oxidase assembly chaperone [Flavobacterium orientale]|uniref:CcoQ/FixQ family Cbb3-type cytochrome c oxidase assembly chaperone n=1 Tax=Flavobacterium orientale TaxID=1756020 RepID=UPI001665A3AE|nr:CcoQ/FixQ family Cbb3-type cytochrome c oxidase assembly chaperone [Flavobacterium orientale]
MLKFIKHHMDSISGIEIYPIISLSIFFLFFVMLLIWVFSYSKDRIKELSDIPLNEDK